MNAPAVADTSFALRAGRARQQRDVDERAKADARRHAPVLGQDLRDLRDGADLDAIERAYRRRDTEAVVRAAIWRDVIADPSEPMLLDGLDSGLTLAEKHDDRPTARSIARADGGRRRTQWPTRSQQWARSQAAELVTETTDESKQAIRDAVADAIRTGGGSRESAESIQRVIGLSTRDAAAVDRYLGGQLASELPMGTALERADAYAEELRARRADLIARTETSRAVNRGRDDYWHERVDDGELEADAIARVWQVSPQKDVDVCTRLNGVAVGLDEPFRAGGARFFAPPDPHPGCRCAIVYETGRHPRRTR